MPVLYLFLAGENPKVKQKQNEGNRKGQLNSGYF